MKFTQKQLSELITILLPKDVELVADDAETDFDLDEAIKLVDASREGIIKNKIESELKATAQKSADGKAIGTLKASLKRWSGAPESLFTKDMTYDQIVEAALGHYTTTIDADKGDAQKQLDEILSKHQAETERIKQEHNTQLSELTGKLTKRDMLAFIENEMKDAPIRKGYDRKIAVEDAFNHLSSQFDLKWDNEKNEMQILDKKTGISALNAAGTLPVKSLDVIKPFFESRGAWEKDMRNADAATVTNQQGQAYQGAGKPPQSGKPTVEAQRESRLAALQQVVQQ